MLLLKFSHIFAFYISISFVTPHWGVYFCAFICCSCHQCYEIQPDKNASLDDSQNIIDMENSPQPEFFEPSDVFDDAEGSADIENQIELEGGEGVLEEIPEMVNHYFVFMHCLI